VATSSGKNISYQTVNAIRKVCINQIPIYAFHPSKINITRNNSVFDNSYMRERLSQIPINKFDHKVVLLNSKYYFVS
jgi:DNA-directed RNA polymerase alpha subunit